MDSVGFPLSVEPIAIYVDDVHLLQFSLNLEHLLAEFYLYGALGCGLDKLLADLLGVAAGQDAVIRKYLYERADYKVYPYDHTVAKYTERVSALSNALGMCGIKDEGIRVPPYLGAENRTTSNLLSADYNSLSYAGTPREVLRIVYATGSEHVPGGFFPKGENGKIARELLLYHYKS
ncbi:hypothetical protein C5167_021857 [Papaver somniferum]|uniref:Desiccation-related protein PCC13-62 n=1 Tax=Papaver somniferum TaxID=3469 RepID=A0A4Y7JJ60_PAPSO|nr:hypothetical protein C5167_021857 [Papaver somniferum]